MKEIELTQGKVAIVDDEDFEYLSQWKWCAAFMTRNFYAAKSISINGQRKVILMHRFILNPEKNMVVDHINGNTLDNRRENLRICTPRENSRNRKKRTISKNKYKGVANSNGKFIARIEIHLGTFENEIDAAKAYNEAAKNLFGDFAKLNFIEETT